MKKFFIFCMIMFSLLGVVTAAEVVTESTDTIFKLNQNVNYRFRCYDAAGAYCTSGTVLIINIEYPDGSNAVDNQTLQFQNTYFNYTLPTDQAGTDYKVLIHSTTSNNTVAEFTYDVTYTGFNETLGNFGIVILFIILVVYVMGSVGFFFNQPIVSLFGGLGMMILGITIINQGILIFRNDLTIAFASITIGLGAYFAIAAAANLADLN